MTQYMLLFSLGPVQSFITQARKTRDLWLGSFLLSALMQVGIEGMNKDIESKLIYPSDPTITGIIPDLPNKYIAIFNNADDATKAARQCEESIRKLWQIICVDVWRTVLSKPARGNEETYNQWRKQISPESVFEFFWVVVKRDERVYSAWLNETQQVFDGRKHLRDFQQQEESGEKSTISGLHSALRGSGEQRSHVQDFWKQVAKGQSPRDIGQDGSERLDAIDTVKRFAFLSKRFKKKFNIPEHESGLGFPSTSSIAVAPFLERLILASGTNDPQLSTAIDKWIKESQQLGEIMPATIPFLTKRADQHEQSRTILKLDGDCLFSETFHPQRLEKEFGFDDTRAEERAKLASSGPDALSKLFKLTDNLSILRPTPYYAMIYMDGDRMGRLISGVQGQEEEHQAISKALSTFSREIVPLLVVHAYPGRLVYAGGDDVVALAPLARDFGGAIPTDEITTVLQLVYQLQLQYQNVVRPAVVGLERKRQVTASVGIAIAHHYTSLSYVRRVTKAAEQLAKNHYGRNALVVTVLRRSGEQTRVGCRWQYSNLEANAQPIPLFLAFYKLFKNDVLSPKCVFSLLEEAPTLVVLSLSAQVSEVKRILRRQRNPSLEGSLSDDEILQKAQLLVALAGAMDKDEDPHINKEQKPSVELHSERRRYGLVEVLGWLLVMLFLARKEQE